MFSMLRSFSALPLKRPAVEGLPWVAGGLMEAICAPGAAACALALPGVVPAVGGGRGSSTASQRAKGWLVGPSLLSGLCSPCLAMSLDHLGYVINGVAFTE